MEQTTHTSSLLARDDGESVVIYDPDEDDAWIRCDDAVRVRWRR